MLALKTPLAFIIAVVIAVVAFFVSSALAASSFAAFLPSIFSIVTVLILFVVSTLIHSNNQSESKVSRPSNSQTQKVNAPQASSSSESGVSTLYIGNLAYKANESLVQEHFEKIGKVNLVRLVKDKKTGRRKGFGFVEISANDEDLFISKLNETEFMERNIIVRTANDKKH
jgi:hypothetical protein